MNRPGLLALAAFLLALAFVPTIGLSQTYTTTFDGDENPLSEGGKWVHNGVDWAMFRKQGGLAYGMQTGTNTGAKRYDDAYAHLTGFPPDQEAWGEVRITRPDPSCIRNVRSSCVGPVPSTVPPGMSALPAAQATIRRTCKLSAGRGPLGKFTYLADKHGPEYGPEGRRRPEGDGGRQRDHGLCQRSRKGQGYRRHVQDGKSRHRPLPGVSRRPGRRDQRRLWIQELYRQGTRRSKELVVAPVVETDQWFSRRLAGQPL